MCPSLVTRLSLDDANFSSDDEAVRDLQLIMVRVLFAE